MVGEKGCAVVMSLVKREQNQKKNVHLFRTNSFIINVTEAEGKSGI